jgi:hypothetical protein
LSSPLSPSCTLWIVIILLRRQYSGFPFASMTSVC